MTFTWDLFLRLFAERAHVFNHLRDLLIAQLLSERRHVCPSIVHCFVQFGVGFFLNVFRVKIGRLQLFSQRSIASSIRAVAEHAFGFEDSPAATSFRPRKIRKRQHYNSTEK